MIKINGKQVKFCPHCGSTNLTPGTNTYVLIVCDEYRENTLGDIIEFDCVVCKNHICIG
jgi:hypothetical protein